MKIGMIGDVHIGASLNLGRPDKESNINFRLLDFSKTFDGIIDTFYSKGVRKVILLGDVFETKHPTSIQLNIFSKCLARAIDKGVEFFIIAGNHDRQRIIKSTTVDLFGLIKTKGIKTYSSFDHVILEEGGQKVNILFMPYEDRKMLGVKTNKDAIDVISKRIGVRLKSFSDGLSLAVGHFMIDKEEPAIDGESFSMSEVIIPTTVFSNFDCVVMGHVHNHMVLSNKSPIAIYSGSMENNTFNDKGSEKFSFIYDTDFPDKLEKINNKTRKLFEIDLNYSEKQHKQKINSIIKKDILQFNKKFNVGGSISKISIKVKECDLHHVSQEKIKKILYGLGVKNVSSIHIASVSSRKLRNEEINETLDHKEAMKKFISSLSENQEFKNKILKMANVVIEEIG